MRVLLPRFKRLESLGSGGYHYDKQNYKIFEKDPDSKNRTF